MTELVGSVPSLKKLGLWTTTSLVIGNMIGAGIFLIPATLAAYGGIASSVGCCQQRVPF